ncbi:MAG: tetratricopeptide repeat protein, partial [Planctomycetota bacterium]
MTRKAILFLVTTSVLLGVIILLAITVPVSDTGNEAWPPPDPYSWKRSSVKPRPMTEAIRRIIDNYTVEARKNYDGGEIDEAIRNGEEALRFLMGHGQDFEAAERRLEIGKWYIERGAKTDVERGTQYHIAVYHDGLGRGSEDWCRLAERALEAHRSIVLDLTEAGRGKDALTALGILLKKFVAVGNRIQEAQILHILAWVNGEMEAYASAVGLYREALAVRREIGDRRGETWTLNNLGYIQYRAGDLEASASHLLEALKIAEKEVPDPWRKVVDNLILLCQAAQKEGLWVLAISVGDQMIPSIRRKGLWYLTDRVLFLHAKSLRGAREFARAKEVIEALIKRAREER